eukprot:403348260
MEGLRKRQKQAHIDPEQQLAAAKKLENKVEKTEVRIKFQDVEGNEIADEIMIDSAASKIDLNKLLDQLIGADEKQLYQFYLDDKEVRGSIKEVLEKAMKTNKKIKAETIIPLTYKPEAMFRIRPITRASSTLEGHSEAILSVAFSPDGKSLASGSGDTTVRIWDLLTETPLETCVGHKHWVLFVSFSPDCKRIASGGMDHSIFVWNAEDGKQVGRPLKGHKNFVTSISWQPMISSYESRNMASSSKDQTIKVWDVNNSTCIKNFTSHTASVTKVLWGGEGLIYSASQDRTIKVWDFETGVMTQELKGHAHWVNTLALSTDYVLRTGCYDHTQKEFEDNKQMQKYAIERYEKIKDPQGERLVSGSDDLTMFMWQPKQGSKQIARMTGHQGLINMAAFSPDGFYLVSASFDNSIKIWDGKTGKFISSLRGHVNSVYQVAWSADSRLLVSGSKDSTLKVWDIEKRKLMFDLPGHADEIYAIDWSPDGEKVASGSKDRMLRIWRN